MDRGAAAVMIAAMIVVTGCAGSRVSDRPSMTPSPSAVASTPPAHGEAPSPSPLASSVNTLTRRCRSDVPCVLTPGTWVTAGYGASYGFVPGFTLAVPAGWTAEVDPGQLKLIEAAHGNDALRFWLDVAAIESDGSSETPKVLNDVPRTVAGLTAAFRANPDFVVSTPTATTIGGTITALTYTLGVSRSAAYQSQGCPSHPACANILTDPLHWRSDDFFAIGAPEVVRLYLATVGTASDPHTLVICIDATDPVELARLTAVATPIIESIRLPAVISDR